MNHSQKYQCPQQKKLRIPFSRFNDGICDCCDGSDENPGLCPDICDQVLAEERALLEKMEREFKIGYEKRQKEIYVFQTTLQEAQGKKTIVDEELEGVQEKLTEVESNIDQVKHEYMQQRVTRAAEITNRVALTEASSSNNDSLTGLLEPLSNDEITNLIVHSCQMAGEMTRADNLDGTTCVPLRLAGLDLALMWTRENNAKANLNRLHMNVREEGKRLADKLVDNAKKEEDKDKEIFEGSQRQTKKHKNKKRSRPRRRLQAISDDEEIEDYPDEYGDYDEEEDYIEDSGDFPDYADEEGGDDEAENDKEVELSEEDKVFETVRDSLFSQPRVTFLQRSQEIVDGIDALFKEHDEKEKNEKEEENAESPTIDTLDRDPYKNVKSTLEDREHTIERGYDYAVSAKILLNSLVEATPDESQLRKDLLSLAVGTLVYGELSTAHVWQIFQAILPEFLLEAQEQEKEKTCSTSPWAASCPPRSITRQGTSFPPQQVLQAAQALCTTPTFTQEKAQACSDDAGNELPTVMPDGYYGYEVVQPRNTSDPLDAFAAEWDFPLDHSIEAKLDKLAETKSKVEEEKREVEKSMEDITDLVDGAKESKFGREGELYALKDDCFSVKAGKYTYEGCAFRDAAQKEGDSKSGTGLGKWEGVEYEEETGKRIFKWTDGVKCWNGPKRSATAYVTCGAETKVLLADEPDTCRYVLQMESHIACDDDFKKLHDL